MTDWKSKWFPSLVAVFPVVFPLYLFRSTWFGVPVTMVEMALLILFVLFIFTEKLWQPKWWHQNISHWKLWPVALFLGAAVLSVFVVQGPQEWLDATTFDGPSRALGILKGWFLAAMLYFFMARHVFSERPSYVTLALDALLFGAGVLALSAIRQEVTGDFLTADGRASGPFESANYLSLYLGPSLVYGALQTLADADWNFRRSLRLLLTILVGIALYFTESYAAWIAVLSSAVLFLTLSFRHWPKKWKKAFLLGTVLIGGVLILSQLGSEKFNQFFELSERSSSSVRLEVYEISLNLLLNHPVLGLGLGQFEWFYQTQAVEILGHAPFEWVMLHPHNIFLAMWLNLGILGLVAFVWLCVRALAWLFEDDKKGRRTVAFMLVTLLIHGLFDTPYFKNDLAFQFWLMMAVLL